jgi:hypothetical protein
MSNVDREQWSERLRQNHPLEFSLGLEIMNRFGDIAQDVYADARISPRKIEFLIGKHDETNKPALMMPEGDGMLLIAAIARTAIELILSVVDNTGELQSKLAEKAKIRVTRITESRTVVTKCSACGHDNKYYENYCTKCGNMLRE